MLFGLEMFSAVRSNRFGSREARFLFQQHRKKMLNKRTPGEISDPIMFNTFSKSTALLLYYIRIV